MPGLISGNKKKITLLKMLSITTHKTWFLMLSIVEINVEMVLSLEVDFVCNRGEVDAITFKVTTHLDTREKTLQEQRPLLHIGDNFKKIIIVRDDIKPWYTEESILVLGLYDFLLDNDSIL